METTIESIANEEFVTIVSVGNNPEVSKPVSEVPFVTVLSIGQQHGAEEEVTVYRLPGEKLGFGLKFEGGTKSAECVRRLFIQSCASDTPAGRAKAAWGPLDAGDEILCIDRVPVTGLTRLECVRCLKDSNVAVKLLIRHFPEGKLNLINGNGVTDADNVVIETDRSSLPPPVPPRKIPRKNNKEPSFNADIYITTNGTNKSVSTLEINHSDKKHLDVIEVNQMRKGPLGRQSPGRPRRPAPVHTAPPPEAQFYIDVTKENGIHVAESESDDTGSSISTVIDRLSAYSSFPGSVENSIPSTPTLGAKQINMHVLNGKFDENFLADISSRVIEHFNTKDAVKTNGKIMASDIFNLDHQDTNVMSQNNPVVITLNAVKLEEVNSDANNNTNAAKVEKSVDVVDNVKVIAPEVPKPLPRNLIKKHLEQIDFDDINRPYDDNLSPTKLQNIETWLKDAIGCNLDEDTDKKDAPDESQKPEALPRLIDFVPKMKNQAEPEPVDAKEVFSVKLSINVNKQPVVQEDNDWTYDGGSSPQLETIGEDDEDSPNCPTLPIIKVTQQPPSITTSVESSPQYSSDAPKLSPPSSPPIITTSPPIVIKSPKMILDLESKESGVTVVVTRGPRSPPDGRENPAIHQDIPPPFPNNPPPKLQISQDNMNMKKPTSNYAKESVFSEQFQRSISYEPVKMRSNQKTYGRGKDAKSEGSVRDKIAMFSSQKDVVNNSSQKMNTLTKADAKQNMPQNRLSGYYSDSLSKSYESLLDNAPTMKRAIPDLPKTNVERLTNGSSNNVSDNRVIKTVPSYTKSTYDNKKYAEDADVVKITPFITRDIQTCAKNESHKSTIDYLIEQRRKSMTKLRGLVIPDSPYISDLPEIRSKDSFKILSSSILDRSSTLDRSPTKKSMSPSNLSSMWDTQPILNNVPKYSPAFKRKPLQVYGPKTTTTNVISKSSINNLDKENKLERITPCVINNVPSKPPRIALENKRNIDQLDKKTHTLPINYRGSSLINHNINSSQQPLKAKRQDLFSSMDTVDNANLKIFKAFSDNADSDNDSAVSSTQSSYLSTVSSPTPSLNTVDNTESDCSSQSTLSRGLNNVKVTNGLNSMYLENGKRNVCRSLSSDTSTSVGSSNSSTLTSGSQASCSSAGSSNADSGHRILKPRSIEAINRKNILASAKCRSGKDNKFGSPLIERKFSDDSTVESTDEGEITKKPQFIPKEHQFNGNGDVVKYHTIKNSSLPAYGDALVKVAFTTLVEDKCSLNSTYSDTGSDSDCDTGKHAKIAKKFSGSVVTPQTNGDSRRVVESFVKPPPEPAKSRRSVSNTSEEEEQDEQECFEVRLSRAGGAGVGVILAGGVDCEAKEVTIHKVLQGSAAERDGRLCKGDKIVSINGHTMRGVSHSQSVAILKDPQPEVSIIVRGKQPASDKSNNYSSIDPATSTIISVELEKADAPGGAGLGISLQGGGNRPLLINKLFTGGAAARNGRIVSGSELLAAGGTKLTGLTRTEAWGLLRALPAGPVSLVLRPP